jgi:hypothetical protein
VATRAKLVFVQDVYVEMDCHPFGKLQIDKTALKGLDPGKFVCTDVMNYGIK